MYNNTVILIRLFLEVNVMSFINNTIMLAEQAANGQQGSALSGWTGIIMLVVMIVFMYFVMIRPQKKQQKKEALMRSSLQIGDEIITIGGIYGRVVSLKDESIVIESSGDRSKIQITRTAVAQNLTEHDEPGK